MDEHMEHRITCGEYLQKQRNELMKLRDLGAPGGKERAVKCLANIYAVSYQMNFERREPPSRRRGPADQELLDRKLVRHMARGLLEKANAFQVIADDPWRLGQAIVSAQEGNGVELIRMVTAAHLAKTAMTPRREQTTAGPEQRSAAPEGPTL